VTACRGFQRTALPKHRPHLDRQNKTKTTLFTILQMHCTENSKKMFPEMKLRGLVPNFYIHVLYL
jgi:hypothetical protein